jgi:hypothetical protein
MPAPTVAAAPAAMPCFRNDRRLDVLRAGEFDSVEVEVPVVSELRTVGEVLSLLINLRSKFSWIGVLNRAEDSIDSNANAE